MTDPFAIFRVECDALIRSRVREPAGYVFEVPPKRDMGQLGCNVAFQLTRLRKNHPPNIARDIVAGMDRTLFRLVRDVQVAGPGFINSTSTSAPTPASSWTPSRPTATAMAAANRTTSAAC